MIDYDALALAPIYETLGFPATFTVTKDSRLRKITVLDGTAGVEIGSSLAISTTRAALGARVSDLKALGLTPADMIGAVFSFKNRRLTVVDPVPAPSPGGDGQLWLIVAEG